jgi:polyphosphate kinase
VLQRTRIPVSKIKPQFLARELALLAFNERVLAQAEDRRVPVLERLRFLCILSSNLDEFFEIRMAELKERIRLGNEIEPPGKRCREVFPPISERVRLGRPAVPTAQQGDPPAACRRGVRFAEQDGPRSSAPGCTTIS